LLGASQEVDFSPSNFRVEIRVIVPFGGISKKSIEMESINLIKNRHKLCTDEGNNEMYNSEGSLLVFDMIGKQ